MIWTETGTPKGLCTVGLTIAILCARGLEGQDIEISEKPIPTEEWIRISGVVRFHEGPLAGAKATLEIWSSYSGEQVASVETVTDDSGRYELLLDSAPLFRSGGDYEFTLRAEASGFAQGRAHYSHDGPLLGREVVEFETVELVRPVDLVGRVLSKSGSAVEGALVLLEMDGRVSTKTNEDGEFRFEGRRGAIGRLRVLAEGYARFDSPLPRLVRGRPDTTDRRREASVQQGRDGAGTLALRPIVLEQEQVLVGRVVDERGTPVSNAIVAVPDWDLEIASDDAGSGTELDRFEARTDSEGRFTLAGLSHQQVTESYGFVARAKGFLSAYPRNPSAEELSPGHFELSSPFRLVTAAGLSGSVLDQHGRIVAGARVSLVDRESPFVVAGVPVDGRGRFVFAEIRPNAPYEVRADAPYHRSASHRFRAITGGTTELNLELRGYEAGEVEFRAIDTDGQPLDHAVAHMAPVEAHAVTGQSSEAMGEWTTPRGRMLYREVPVGRYTVTVEHHRCLRTPDETIEVGAGTRVEVRATLDCRHEEPIEQLTIQGRAVDSSGSGIADAVVSVNGRQVLLTDDHGSFAVTVARGSDSWITIEKPGTPGWGKIEQWQGSVDLGDVELVGGFRLKGRLLGAPRGVVDIFAEPETLGQLPIQTSAAADRFVITGLRSGIYSVTAIAGQLKSESVRLELIEAEVPPELVLRFPPTYALEGRVLVDGKPREVRLTVRSSERTGDFYEMPMVDDRGDFSVLAVPAGSVVIEAALDGGSYEHRIDVPVERPVELMLSTGTLAGTLVDSDGIALSKVELELQTARASDHSPMKILTTDVDGRFRIDGLLEGEWILSISDDTWQLRRNIAVAPGFNEVLLEARPSKRRRQAVDGPL